MVNSQNSENDRDRVTYIVIESAFVENMACHAAVGLARRRSACSLSAT